MVPPTPMVREVMEELKNLTDNEIAKKYIKNRTEPYPSMIEHFALGEILKQRKIRVKVTVGYQIIRLDEKEEEE